MNGEHEMRTIVVDWNVDLCITTTTTTEKSRNNRLFFFCFVRRCESFSGKCFGSSDLRPSQLDMDLTKRQQARAAVVVCLVLLLAISRRRPSFLCVCLFRWSRPSLVRHRCPTCAILQSSLAMPSADSLLCISNTRRRFFWFVFFVFLRAGVATLFFCPAVCHSSWTDGRINKSKVHKTRKRNYPWDEHTARMSLTTFE